LGSVESDGVERVGPEVICGKVKSEKEGEGGGRVHIMRNVVEKRGVHVN